MTRTRAPADFSRTALVVAASVLVMAGCAPWIEPAPRAGGSGAALPIVETTTSTSVPGGPGLSVAPVLEVPPPRADGNEEWRTLTLTADAVWQSAPALDDHYVVWQGTDARSPDIAQHDAEIYLYDLLTGETRMLTDDAAPDTDPQIEGPWVVWLHEATDGSGTELLAYRLDTGATRVLATGVERSGSDDAFALSGGAVVWTAGRSPETEVHAYLLSTGREVVVSDGRGRNHSPDTDGVAVVWLSQTAEGEALMYSDLYSGDAEVIAEITPGSSSPQVDGGLIVWSDWDGADSEIYLSRPSVTLGSRAAPERLTDDQKDDLAPRLDGGLVVWREGRPYVSSGASAGEAVAAPARIMLYDVVMERGRVLDAHAGPAAWPDIEGGLVFWKASEDEGLVVYDALAEQTAVLGRKIVGSDRPIAGRSGRLAWSAWEGVDPEILLAYRGVRPVALPPKDLRASFTDTARSPYSEAIETLASRRVVATTGSTEGEGIPFRPEDPITRAEFIVMLETLVPPSNRGSAAAGTGPAGTLTRGQLVSLAVGALRTERPWSVRLLPVGYVGTVTYQDPDHGEALRLAERNRLLDGFVGFSSDWDTWRPATRGEAAQILANTLGLLDGVATAGATPSSLGDGPPGFLAPPRLSAADTATIVRDRISWQIVSAQLDVREVETSVDVRGLQVLHVTMGSALSTSAEEAVDEFMRRGLGGVVSIAAALNAGRGAQIGLVRVELIGDSDVDLVSYSGDLEDRRSSLTLDPSVVDQVQRSTAATRSQQRSWSLEPRIW
ncbi:MAG: S-layer homology domain-containing protein [Thermoleophilia bacterium]